MDKVARLRRLHKRIRELLPELSRMRGPHRAREWEEVLFQWFRMEGPELYNELSRRHGEDHSGATMMFALREGLNPIKVLVLGFLDGERSAARELAAELPVRIKLEEEYLIPLLEGSADHCSNPNSE